MDESSIAIIFDVVALLVVVGLFSFAFKCIKGDSDD